MSASRSAVEAGDYILIPTHEKAPDHSLKRVKLRWHQYFQTRNERYDHVMVKNINHSRSIWNEGAQNIYLEYWWAPDPENEIHMFIQANWYRRYEDDTELPDQHLDKVAEVTEDGCKYNQFLQCLN